MNGEASPRNSPTRISGLALITNSVMVIARRISQRTNTKMDLRFIESPPFRYVKTRKTKGALGAFLFRISSIFPFFQKGQLDGRLNRRDARIAAPVAFVIRHRHGIKMISDDVDANVSAMLGQGLSDPFRAEPF